MTCNHASGGCDYPAGECAGSCLQKSTREGWGHVADLEVECKALRDEIISARAQRQAAHRYIETLLDQQAELLNALKACDEAMSYMSEYDIPLTLPDVVKSAIAKVVGN